MTIHRKVTAASLVTFFVVFSGLNSAQIKEVARPPIRQIDHIMIRLDDPAKLYAFFTDTLRLPVAWRKRVTIDSSKIEGLNIQLIENL